MLSDSPPRLEPVRQPTLVQPVVHPQTFTLNTLRTHEDSRRRVAAYYADLEKEASFLKDGSSGDLSNISHKRSVKSGRDRTGADDIRLVYMKRPRAAYFFGPEKRRIKYDDLTHPSGSRV